MSPSGEPAGLGRRLVRGRRSVAANELVRERPERAAQQRRGEESQSESKTPDAMAGPSERAGFSDAPEIGPPTREASAIVPPTAIAAASPTAGAGRDGHDHEEQDRGQDQLPERTTGTATPKASSRQHRPRSERDAEQHRRDRRTRDLRRPVGRDTGSRKVASQRERERHRRVQVRTGECPTA
jgi:hypothetical protein